MSPSKSKTKILRFFWGAFPWLIVIAIGFFIFSLWGRITEKKARLEEENKAAIRESAPPVRVITLTLEPKTLEDKLTLPAMVVPYENLWVKAEVPGQVVKVLVKEGQMIEAGQVLVELDDRDYRSRLERIEANYQLALSDRDRISELVKKKIAAATELDKTEARLKDLAAQLKEAQLALDRTRIISPISGRLNDLTTETGDRLGVDKPVAQILQFDDVKVTVGVPESDVSAVFDLDEADVIIEALDKRRVKGKKVFLSRQPRDLARLYDLELAVANPDGRILPGMFARVELVKKVYQDALVIPLYAVIAQGDENFVYVEEGNQAVKRSVQLGILSGWQIQITSGLQSGEKVIVVGHRLLDDGQAVETVKDVRDPEEILSL
ncbi:MAG: efflux RND transporter periplasmic adaptor subunit [Deltaproteobacteria bacterium]|nr:efflux RND transporter periplasmic adaptor subunit [Deltaproteobacteria bacterium]